MIDKNNIIRYMNFFKRNIQNIVNRITWATSNSSNKLKAEYVDWLINENINNKKDFVPISDKDFEIKDDMPKLIAFYLPQYYENESNNKYFGKGFMEWYNTTKCIPQFKGHYQPHLPIDVGFYNLTHDDIMYRQIELAKQYGIQGFCFYYYWFSGERMLEKPLDNFMKNKDLNMPFCLFWANETWTTIWGDNKEPKTIIEQKLREGDDEKFANDIIKYFNDERYIRMNNKPVLIIYNSRLFQKDRFNKFLSVLRTKVSEAGFDGVTVLTTDSKIPGCVNIDGLDLDGVIEFGHNNMNHYNLDCLVNLKGRFVNPNFKGRVIDIKRALKNNRHLVKNDCKTFRCVAAGWDNSSRKAYTGAEIFDMTPAEYELWLRDSIKWTKENLSEEEQIVFLDSWNEWAEGAHLEPDQKYGYAYLQATQNALLDI